MADPGATPRSRTCQRLSGWGSETEPGRRSRGERDTRRRRPESSVAPGVRGAFCEALVRDALGVARVGDTRDSPRTVRKETRDRKRTGKERTDGPFSDADSAICNARPFPASAVSTSRSRPSPPVGPPAERYLPSVRGSRVALCEAPLLARVSSAAPLPTGGPSPSPGSAWSP